MTRTRLALTSLSLFTLSACASAGAAGGSKAPLADVAGPSPSSPSATPSVAKDSDGMADDAKAAPRDEERAVVPAQAPPPPPAPMAAASSAPDSGRAAGGSRPPASIAAAPKMDSAGEPGGRPRAAVVAAPAEIAVAPAGPVKAGEWDDNANYREFQRWLGTEQRQPFHRADPGDRQFLVVRDAEGKGVPRCSVVVTDAQGHRAALTTTASGRALLFPRAEGLAGDLTASTTCQNSAASARFSPAQTDGVVDLKLAVKRVLPAQREVDVAFILDTTGSMSEEIAAVKATIQKVAASLSTNGVRVRIGLVEYKDRSDSFVTRVYPMTTDTAKFSREVAGISAGGGGDVPESMNEGLHVGLNGLDWNGPAVAKLAFLIADAPPHLDYPNDFDYASDMRDAAHRGIQVFTVAASGMDDLGQVVFRQIAQYTGATNLFVLRGGAGPQSTGGGDPKSSCGGTQTAFVSGNLDALIVQKVSRELHGLDRDPLKIPGLVTDENAKPCAERLMIAE